MKPGVLLELFQRRNFSFSFEGAGTILSREHIKPEKGFAVTFLLEKRLSQTG